MSLEKVTAQETRFMRDLYQQGALKVGEGPDDFRKEMAARLQGRGLVRTVGADIADQEGCYMVLTGRGVIVTESLA